MHSYLIEAFLVWNILIRPVKSSTAGTLNVYELNGDLINQLVVFNGKSNESF
jgi:hypothetical protein